MEDEVLCDAWLDVSAGSLGRSEGWAFWQQVHESFHARKHIAPYDMYIIQHCNGRSLSYHWHTIQTSVTKFCDVIRQLKARWPLHAADRKFCFLLLNLLINSFTQCCSTHCVARTRCGDVPQERGTTIYVHTLLDEAEGTVCVGQQDPLKNVFNIEFETLLY